MSALRFDRLVSSYVFYPLRRGWAQNGLPILMYHSVSDRRTSRDHPYYATETALAVFRQHMAFLRDNHYTVLGLPDIWQHLNSTRPLSKLVVLTFDDGYQDFYTNAFPVLSQHCFTATVFVPTGSISDTPKLFKGKPSLTWKQVRELHRAGIQFGSHTVSHPQLWRLKRHEIESELRNSKFTLEDKIGSQVCSFAYPFAFPEQDRAFASLLRNTLQLCGYEIGVSTILGSAHSSDEPFFLPRLPINSFDDPVLFRAKLAGAYDWLHIPQFLSKFAKYRTQPSAALLQNATS